MDMPANTIADHPAVQSGTLRTGIIIVEDSLRSHVAAIVKGRFGSEAEIQIDMGAEKASAAESLESVSTDSRHYPQKGVHASLKAVNA
jgi:hypothetical protein